MFNNQIILNYFALLLAPLAKLKQLQPGELELNQTFETSNPSLWLRNMRTFRMSGRDIYSAEYKY